MDEMSLLTTGIVIAAVWLLGVAAVVALCRAAARGDRVLEARLRVRRRTHGSHEHPLPR
jgi:hypothetical protein